MPSCLAARSATHSGCSSLGPEVGMQGFAGPSHCSCTSFLFTDFVVWPQASHSAWPCRWSDLEVTSQQRARVQSSPSETILDPACLLPACRLSSVACLSLVDLLVMAALMVHGPWSVDDGSCLAHNTFWLLMAPHFPWDNPDRQPPVALPTILAVVPGNTIARF